ncbi:FecR family protein [Seonamhaeicola sp.]|uniref:FecR family protein n=1 Tax=Seonamhaeicola sp. TaxID=1912245 RepID=UPI00262EB915|nr:FecR family protein [Seonamhaeicola sp.]
MKKQYTDDTFLARWISGELTPEELEAFKASGDYKTFKRINDKAQQLKSPSYDKEAAFSELLENIDAKKKTTKVVKLVPNWVYSTAAVLVVTLGILFFMNNRSTHFKTSYGEQLVVTLPDHSKVNLNANSSLEFKAKHWEEHRIVRFQGEAFFDVEKGTSFKVSSNQGTVEVLGTEFNVISRQNYFEVRCYEGRVRVLNPDNDIEVLLESGKAIRIVENKGETWVFNEVTPSWIQTGESSFINTPLKQVIIALENQYKVKIDVSGVDLERRFTGSFTHNDLNLALKTVFEPLDITYTTTGNNTILLKDK